MEWIKCSDRMPSSFLKVLVIDRNCVVMGYYFEKTDEWNIDESEKPRCSCRIKYWMLLPEVAKD